MPNSADVVNALRDHLVAAGIVRKGNVAGPLPPMVLDPLQGAPAPGELEGIVNDPDLLITARPGGDLTPAPPDGWLLQTTVDVIYRGKHSDRIAAVDAAITAELFLPGGMCKTAWMMGPLQMIETRIWAGMQRLESSKAAGYTYITKVYAETYR
jgi:hypothetical protein